MNYPLLSLTLLTLGCTNPQYSSEEGEKTEVSVEQSKEDTPDDAPPSDNDMMVANIRNFLTEEYLKDDLAVMPAEDRKFQFYQIDLNGDGNREIFVRFLSPYFCGSGGCTFLLLDEYGEVITRFTVIRAPIFVEDNRKNGWAVLLVKDGDVFRELAYEDGSYPSNPSVVDKAPYDAPSGHAQVLFDEELGPAKTYTF
jgi:hypothetical protein